MSETQWSAPSGAKRSKRMPLFNLIPRAALVCLADRLELGAKTYEENNWKKGVDDDIFMRDVLNHAQHHLSSLMEKDISEDDAYGHAGALLFAGMVLAYYLDERNKPSE